MMRRFSSRTLTGMLRKLVAVGTVRLCSMFSTIFFAGPVIGFASESAGTIVAGFDTLATARVSACGVAARVSG